jgi:hypothetical protein
MNRLTSSLKVLTLFNIKISAILIILGFSIFFGCKYLQISETERKHILVNIKENEQNSIKKTTIVNNIISIDGKLLSKALNKKTTTRLIKKDLDAIRSNTKSLDPRLQCIINRKERIYQQINNFNSESIDFDNIKSTKNISIVSKNVRKTLFKTKTSYDTIYKKYNDINEFEYYKEYNRILKLNSKNLNELIYKNNELTLKMKIIIDEYSRDQMNKNILENQLLLEKLKKNTNTFIIKSFIIAFIIGILLYLIIIDIRKIKKSSQRNSEVISILLENTKESIRDKDK